MNGTLMGYYDYYMTMDMSGSCVYIYIYIFCIYTTNNGKQGTQGSCESPVVESIGSFNKVMVDPPVTMTGFQC